MISNTPEVVFVPMTQGKGCNMIDICLMMVLGIEKLMREISSFPSPFSCGQYFHQEVSL